jgi:hypothetical protein
MIKNKKRIFWILIFSIILFTVSSPLGAEIKAKGGDNYSDLVTLFKEFRELQKPKMINGIPDYSVKAMEKQRKQLNNFQRRLKAIDKSTWSVSQKVDCLLVQAEMNGLDFYQRVLKPWARDPGFYLQTQGGAGPTRYGVLRIRKLPIPKENIKEVKMKLKALPEILKRAKVNLTEGAGDLALCALHYMDDEISLYRRIAAAMKKHHPHLLSDANRALVAVKDYGRWLKEKRNKMTAPAGVGKENYNWWLKNVQLLPYTWEECLNIVMHEDYRMITTLELERNRNQHLPELKPVEEQTEHRRRRDQALRFVMEFLKKEKILTIPDYLDIEGYLYRGPLSESEKWPRERDFFEQTGDREPLPEQTHEFIGHYFDEKRRLREHHPIRGTDRFYAIEMIRSEGWAFWMEEMLMHAGYLDKRPERGREIVYLQAAFRTCRFFYVPLCYKYILDTSRKF